MKRFAVVSFAFAALAAPAFAADMPVKAPVVVERYDWSGVYAGVNGGWLGSHIDWQYHNALTGTTNPPLSTASQGSAIIGGQIGIQKQFGNFVLGAEFSANGFIGSDYGSVSCTNAAFNCQSRVNDLLLMLGGRIGFTPIDRMLLFVNGGAAGYGVDTREVLVATGATNVFSSSHRHWAGYIGGGVEYAVWKNLIFGVEYAHIFKSNEHHVTAGTPSIEDRDIGVSADMVRARLSYKFDWLMR